MKLHNTLLTLFITFYASISAAKADVDALALNWLAQIDEGKYAASWQASADYFRKQVSVAQWQAAMEAVRAPLAEVNSRIQTQKTEHNSLPGAPDGEYIVLIFSTSFRHKKSATETLTLTNTAKGWQPVGYFIK